MSERERLTDNVAVLANSVELGVAVIMYLAGKDISNMMDGQLVRPQDIAAAVVAELGVKMAPTMGVR